MKERQIMCCKQKKPAITIYVIGLVFFMLTVFVNNGYAGECSKDQKADARAFVNDGLRAEVESDPKTALRHYRAALNFCPGTPEAHLRIGILRLEQKQCPDDCIRDGIGHLDTYVKNVSNEKKVIALKYMVDFYIRKNRIKDAKYVLAQLKESAPNNSAIEFLSGLLVLVSDQSISDAALIKKMEAFSKSQDIGPAEKQLLDKVLTRRKIDKFTEVFFDSKKLFSQIEGGIKPEECKDVGWCLGEIRKRLIPIVEKYPDFTPAYILLGKTYVVLGQSRDTDRAERFFQKAYALPEGKLELLKLYYMNNQLGKAAAVAKTLKKDAPHSSEANYWMGCIRLLQGREAESVGLFVKSYLLNPKGPIAGPSIKKIAQLDPELKIASYNRSPIELKKIKAAFTLFGLHGRKYAQGDYQFDQYGGRIETSDQKRLERILKQIVTRAVLPDEDYDIAVLNSDRVQALAVDERNKKTVYLTKGFLDFIADIRTGKDDDLLAFVIAHELAHLVFGHNRTAEIVASTVSDGPGGSQKQKEIICAQELEADQQGLHYAFLAGYNPNGALWFMKSFAEKFQETPLNEDHPTFTQRSRALIDYWNTVASPAYLHFGKGISSIKKGNRLEAKSDPKAVAAYLQGANDFHRFLTLFPTSKQGHNNLGFCHLKIGLWGLILEKKKTAFDPWRLSMVYDPAVFQFKRIGLKAPGIVKDPQKHFKKASREFLKAMELDPKYPEAFANYGIYLLLTDRKKEAVAHFEKGVKWKRTAGDCLNNLGVVLAAEKKWGRAQVRFENAMQVNKSLPDPLYNLSLLYQKTGRSKEAASVSENYFKVEKPSSGWRKILSDMLQNITE